MLQSLALCLIFFSIADFLQKLFHTPASEKDAPYQNVRDGFNPDDRAKQHWNPDHKPYDDAIAYTDSLILRSFQYVRWMFPAELNLLPDGMTKEEYRDNRIRLIKRFLLDHGAVSV